MRVHALIGAIVYEDSEAAAIESAVENVYTPLVRNGAFDYCETFDDGETDAYRETTLAVEDVGTEDGRRFVASRFKTMVDEVERQVRRVDRYFDDVDGDYTDL